MPTSFAPIDLSLEDYEQILASLPALYALLDLGSLPTVMLAITAKLIPSVFCTYNELHVHSQNVLIAYEPEEWRERMQPYVAASASYLHEHPLFNNANATDDGSAQAISDFISWEDWAATNFAQILMTPLGMKDTMLFRLNTGNASMIFIAMNRDKWGFSARDKQVANLLRSHFVAAYHNAIAFTNAQALTLISRSPEEASAAGIVAVDAHGNVFHANPQAGVLMRKYFQGEIWSIALPSTVQNWLTHDGFGGLPMSTLEEVSGEFRLEIRWCRQPDGSKLLLLEERRVSPESSLASARLSRRESEVLGWIVEGKTNAEIGIILSISVRTVEKHVETIYQKLGVENRMGAVLRVLSKPAHF